MVGRVAIVGTGLIGASVGLAAARGGAAVAGWDPDAAALAAAVERGAVAGAGSLEEALDGAELAVVAVPIAALPAEVAAVLAATGEQTTVTDVGSTKASVVAAAAGSPRFVGGHPIAGLESRGAEHASAGIFEGATWFLTTTAQTDPGRYRAVHGFVSSLGPAPRKPATERTRRLGVVGLTDQPGSLAKLGAGFLDSHRRDTPRFGHRAGWFSPSRRL